jgi:GxxExxY protein
LEIGENGRIIKTFSPQRSLRPQRGTRQSLISGIKSKAGSKFIFILEGAELTKKDRRKLHLQSPGCLMIGKESDEMTGQDELNRITSIIIGAAIEVHRALGPGLLESAYESCMVFEIADRYGLTVEQQKPLQVIYRGVRLDCGYRLDLFISDLVIVELKSVDKLLPIHEAQMLSYLKLSGSKVGLLINFNVKVLKDGIKRVVNCF